MIALGYKGECIKRYFLDYCVLTATSPSTSATGDVQRHSKAAEDWTVHLVDTGLHTHDRRPHQAARAASSAGRARSC